MKSFDPNLDSIAVIGLGYVGFPLSLLLSSKFNVIGYDIDRNRVRRINTGTSPISEPGVQELLTSALARGRVIFTSNPVELRKARVKMITIGTPLESSMQRIDYSQLESVLDTLAETLRVGDCVILKSTVPPGTTRDIVRSRIESRGFKVPDDIGVAFCPERIVEGQAISDFTSLPKIVGASDPETGAIASMIVGSLGGELVRVSSPEAAELIKLIDNYARFVFLGLVNEIALMSEAIGVDVFEVLAGAKKGYPRNAGLLTPGPGVGGSCLNKDPYILKTQMAQLGLRLKMIGPASEINTQIMPDHVVGLVRRFAGNRRDVTIAGVAFKRETDDTRHSPAKLIVPKLQNLGFRVKATDPYAKLETIEVVTEFFDAIVGSQILVLLADHSVYNQLDLQRLKRGMSADPLIIDTRGVIDRAKSIELGFEYHGLGRL